MSTSASYKCSQAHLYLSCEEAIILIDTHINRLNMASPAFNATYVQDLKLQLQAARSLPSHQTRNEAHESARVDLVKATDDLIDSYELFQFHIDRAYPKDLREAKHEAAGKLHLAKAKRYAWDALESLITSAQYALAAFSADLLANNNMKPSYPNAFDGLVQAVRSAYLEFNAATRASTDGTNAKITANNAIYEAIQDALKLGRIVFKRKPEIADKFHFDSLLDFVSGTSAAGLKGTITNQTNDEPIAGATISLVGTNYTTTTAADGTYDLSPVASGTYTVQCSAPGFQPQTITAKQVKIGTISRLLIELDPVAAPTSTNPPSTNPPSA